MKPRASSNPYAVTSFLERWARDNPPAMLFRATGRAGAVAWRRRFLTALRRAVGPMPEAGSLAARRTEREVLPGGIVREKLYLSASPWHELPLHLLYPEGAKGAPAVLALHGHGAQGAPATRDPANPTYRGYALEYARRGFVVVTPEFRPFGERLETDHHTDGFEGACNGRFVTAMLYGFSLLALNVSDAMRAVDYLARRPEADISRLGCMGLSYGGTAAMYTSALDRRVRRAALSCSFGAIPGHGLYIDELCGPQVAPGILRLGDMAEIAGCIAPRPLLLEVADNDGCFPWPATRSELPRLRRIYRAFGAAEALKVDRFSDGHRFYGKTALSWFDSLMRVSR